MSDYPMLISNKLHSFRNFSMQISLTSRKATWYSIGKKCWMSGDGNFWRKAVVVQT